MHADRFLPIIPKIILNLMLMALETANIYHHLSSFLLQISNRLLFLAIILLKNKHQLIVGLNFSNIKLIQTSYANFTAMLKVDVRY